MCMSVVRKHERSLYDSTVHAASLEPWLHVVDQVSYLAVANLCPTGLDTCQQSLEGVSKRKKPVPNSTTWRGRFTLLPFDTAVAFDGLYTFCFTSSPIRNVSLAALWPLA